MTLLLVGGDFFESANCTFFSPLRYVGKRLLVLFRPPRAGGGGVFPPSIFSRISIVCHAKSSVEHFLFSGFLLLKKSCMAKRGKSFYHHVIAKDFLLRSDLHFPEKKKGGFFFQWIYSVFLSVSTDIFPSRKEGKRRREEKINTKPRRRRGRESFVGK